MCYSNCPHENWDGDCIARPINGKRPCELGDYLEDMNISYEDYRKDLAEEEAEARYDAWMDRRMAYND